MNHDSRAVSNRDRGSSLPRGIRFATHDRRPRAHLATSPTPKHTARQFGAVVREVLFIGRRMVSPSSEVDAPMMRTVPLGDRIHSVRNAFNGHIETPAASGKTLDRPE